MRMKKTNVNACVQPWHSGSVVGMQDVRYSATHPLTASVVLASTVPRGYCRWAQLRGIRTVIALSTITTFTVTGMRGAISAVSRLHQSN